MSTEEDQAYEKLKQECERRGYDYTVMCRLAFLLSEMQGTAIPRDVKKKPKYMRKTKKRKYERLAVLCVETNECFNSCAEAAIAKGMSQSSINKALNGYAKTSAGYHWRYIAKEEKNKK